ncbi:hypothetical protein [Lacticaseibacillus sp. N501-2]|uniref:hypothetical protein n=1 Tax=Lacticaseibacillus salsurae TaxID=3367729 RepID=UPI0038B3B75D
MSEQDLNDFRKATRRKYKSAMAAHDFTNRKMAELLNTNESAISHAINGDSSPLWDRVRREIAIKLGMEESK